MKKFIITISILIVAALALNYAYFTLGWFIDFHPNRSCESFMKVEGDQILMKKGDKFEDFEIKGVNLGPGEPTEWQTDFAIDEKTYLRWFDMIQKMGANTIRVYTVQADTFYNAFYKYNKDRKVPLYLLQGVAVNDYVMNSHRDAYDKDFFDTFLADCRTAVDVIHGRKTIKLGKNAVMGTGSFRKDVSPWVIGYVLGSDWDSSTIAYTNHNFKDIKGYNSYKGKFMYTAENARPFEALLAQIGDKVLSYETSKYKTQRLISFNNWPLTDPFDYTYDIDRYFSKVGEVDVENILCTDKVISGQFAAYQAYTYYPDFLQYTDDWSVTGIEKKDGYRNTYIAYLTALVKHHKMPVVITEFGVSTGRGMAQISESTNINMGNTTETAQGESIIECMKEIKEAGCDGCILFNWQDEWCKRTWNTMYAVDLMRSPYWSDYQTSGQFFGLLTFDPGEKKSICYVDGDTSEWKKSDVVSTNDDITLSMKYDEKFIYFYAQKTGYDFATEKIVIPLDITPKSGSSYCENNGLKFDRGVDFLLTIDGKDNSRVTVQERYEALRSTYSEAVYKMNTYFEYNIPDKHSPKFVNIDMLLDVSNELEVGFKDKEAVKYETGKLVQGIANPEKEGYNSLADFCPTKDGVEIRIPWQLLNFADPSTMEIHDDYYSGNYGVEHIYIDSIYVGVSDTTDQGRIPLKKYNLKGWKNDAIYHERLKPAYYTLQKYWSEDNG